MWEEGLREEQANYPLKPSPGSNNGYKSCLTVQTLSASVLPTLREANWYFQSTEDLFWMKQAQIPQG